MKALDVMVSPVITVAPETLVADAAEILLSNRISGVPVVDKGTLVGILSEGDLLRRAETGTERRRSWLLELLTRGDTIAADYVKSHGRKVSDVMTRHPVTVREDCELAEVADLMESRQIKRLPVMRDDKVVGIVTRTNLLQAFATMQRQAAQEVKLDDRTIRARVLKTIDDANLRRPYGLNVTVQDGKVDLWGAVATYEEKNAIRIATEVTPGVTGVIDNILVQPPMSSGI
jgi:CBS domain-containing protein